MAFSLHNIPAKHRDYARSVCSEIENYSKHGIIGEGITTLRNETSESPNGEKFFAERLYASWRVVFDFNEGKTHEVSIELPEST